MCDQCHLLSVGFVELLNDVNEILPLTLPDVGTLWKPAGMLHPGVIRRLPVLQTPATEEAPPTVSIT